MAFQQERIWINHHVNGMKPMTLCWRRYVKKLWRPWKPGGKGSGVIYYWWNSLRSLFPQEALSRRPLVDEGTKPWLRWRLRRIPLNIDKDPCDWAFDLFGRTTYGWPFKALRLQRWPHHSQWKPLWTWPWMQFQQAGIAFSLSKVGIDIWKSLELVGANPQSVN